MFWKYYIYCGICTVMFWKGVTKIHPSFVIRLYRNILTFISNELFHNFVRNTGQKKLFMLLGVYYGYQTTGEFLFRRHVLTPV